MTTPRRSVLWPVLIIVLGGVWLLALADAFPDAVDDLLRRVWPALLILFGLDVLFGRRRIGRPGRGVSASTVALMFVAAAIVGLVWISYQRQADAQRSENVQHFSQALVDEVDRVRLEIDVLHTDVTLNPAVDSQRALAADYSGSEDSDVAMDWTVQGGIGLLRVVETQSEPLPRLDAYGRSSLTVTLPAGLPVESVGLTAERGNVSADLRLLDVEQLSVALARGDVTVFLPSDAVMQGVVTAERGGVQVLVPPDMRLIVEVERGNPRYEYDTTRYDLLRDGTLKHKEGEPYQYKLDVSVRNGAPLVIEDLTEQAPSTVG